MEFNRSFDMTEKNRFNKHLAKRSRLAARLKQTEAAARLNVSVVHLSYIENGKFQPSIGLLERMAEVYDIHPGDLFGESEAVIGRVV